MKKITVSIVLSLFPYCAFSQVFQTDITVTNPATSTTPGDSLRKTLNFDAANDFFDELSNSGFESSFSNYSNKSIVVANTVYNGVPINVNFPDNTAKLILNIPDLGITKTFNNATRSQSTKALENYLRHDTDGTYTKITEYQVANTPSSQIAGNPTSQQGQLVSSNFNVAANVSAASTTGTQTTAVDTKASTQVNPFAVGVGGGTYQQKGTDVSVINVPISKAFGIDANDARKKLLLNGQFNYVTVGQASSFQGGLGIGYMHPLTDNWYLIPNISYGMVGSQDLASLGQIISGSLASNYQFKVSDYTLSMVNMFGYYKTLPLNISNDIKSDPDIQNYVIKNGFFVSKELPFKVFDHRLSVKGIFTDTEFFGSKVFIRQYNEIGFEINTLEKVKWLDKVTFGLADALTVSAKYIFSIEDPNNLEGYDIGIGYDF
ncbi:MAG: hypothetical protein Q7U57_13215 [Methylovulum sp.]|nr:hypothetical protein [Methylovulum sp.]